MKRRILKNWKISNETGTVLFAKCSLGAYRNELLAVTWRPVAGVCIGVSIGRGGSYIQQETKAGAVTVGWRGGGGRDTTKGRGGARQVPWSRCRTTDSGAARGGGATRGGLDIPERAAGWRDVDGRPGS